MIKMIDPNEKIKKVSSAPKKESNVSNNNNLTQKTSIRHHAVNKWILNADSKYQNVSSTYIFMNNHGNKSDKKVANKPISHIPPNVDCPISLNCLAILGRLLPS